MRSKACGATWTNKMLASSPVIAEAYVSHIRAMTSEARAYVEGLRQEVSADYRLSALEERDKAA